MGMPTKFKFLEAKFIIMALHQWRPLIIGSSGTASNSGSQGQKEAALSDYRARVVARENRRLSKPGKAGGALTSSLQTRPRGKREVLADRSNRLTASDGALTGQL